MSSTSVGLADSNREQPLGDVQSLISQRSGFLRLQAQEEVNEMAVERDEKRLDQIQREVLTGGDHSEYLIAPRTAVKLSSEKRRAVIKDCHRQCRSVSDVVAETITSLADELTEDDRPCSDE